MKYVVNSAQMKSCDQGIIKHYQVPSLVLMERAALAVVEEMKARIPSDASVLIVCGSGNNGGDGLAIGRLLFLDGYPVDIVFAGNEASASEETKAQLSILGKYEIPIQKDILNRSYDVIVDALFGIGLCRNIEGRYAELINTMNAMSGLKIAVDISSGIHGDYGHILGCAFMADLTVTFAFSKVGHLLYPGAAYTGELIIKQIGIDAHGFLGKLPCVYTHDSKDLHLIPKRVSTSNKGTYGKVLVIGGSKNMAGAPCFTAKAAYRMGAGLVRVLTHESNRVILQTNVLEALLTTYSDVIENDYKKILDAIAWATVIVIGPGLGMDSTAKELVEILLEHASVPCVLDADALNLVAKYHIDLSKAKVPIAITPHMGEMARLTSEPIANIKENPIRIALEYSIKHKVITVLKDARTITALPSGEVYINTSGNSGMSTGGSGDVLAGVIAGLFVQGCDFELAAHLGVYIHGLSGDYAIKQLGEHSLMASDLLDGIHHVLKEGI